MIQVVRSPASSQNGLASAIGGLKIVSSMQSSDVEVSSCGPFQLVSIADIPVVSASQLSQLQIVDPNTQVTQVAA